MRLLWASLLAVALCLGLVALGGAASAGERHFEDVVDLTFPAETVAARTPISQGSGFIDTFSEPRGNACGIHRATDIMAPRATKVYAARSGVVTFTRTGHHNWLRVEGPNGYRHTYLHLGEAHGGRDTAFAPGIAEGVPVARGQHIGYVGSSGNAAASAPHLHVELTHPDLHDTPCRDNGRGYYNPYMSLTAAVDLSDGAGGDGAGGDSGDEGGGSGGDDDGGAGGDSGGDEGGGSGGDEGGGGAVDGDLVDRVAGPTRVGTAAELATNAFPDGASHVVVGPAYSFQETIAAGPLAATLDGPVVTTGRDGLHPRAAEAIRQLAPTRVTLVGSTDVLGMEVFDDVVAETDVHAEHVRRLAGDGPAGTAAEVAAEVLATREATTTALVARGADPQGSQAWADALTGGWYGATTQAPVLLTTPDSLPPATVQALEGLDAVAIVGGTAAVSDGVAARLAETVGTVERLSGATRFATATTLVDDLLATGLIDSRQLWTATGGDYADAAAAAAAVAQRGGSLTLIDGGAGEPADGLSGWFDGLADRFVEGRVIGGPEAVSNDARSTLARRLQ
jgi:putative cell wall-binding protein